MRLLAHTGKRYKSHLALSTDTTRCGCVGAGVSTLRESEPGKPGCGDCGYGAGFRKLTAKTGDEKAHGQTEHPELSGTQRGPAAGSRVGNTVARTQHDRGGRMAGACISAGMRCTCLKLRDLVSACESSSSSGSPSGPPASSSPAPDPRTADHVHLAHCTGDRICQGLNAMSAAAAPAVGERRPLPSKWRGLDRRRQRRRRPADVAQRAPSGRAQRFLPRPRSAARPRSNGPPRRSSPPRVPARSPASSPASPAPCRWALGSAPAWSSLGRRGAAPLEPPPRTELLARRAGAAAWKRAPPAALVAPGLGQGLLDRARPPRGIRACSAPPTSISELVRAAAPFLFPFYLCFLPLRLNGVAEAELHRS